MSSRAIAPVSIAVLLAVALSACGASAQDHSSGSSGSARSAGAKTAAAPRASEPSPGVPPETLLAPSGSGVPGPPCGTAAAGVLGATAGAVARRVYAGEEGGTETLSDQRQVEAYTPLLTAVAGGSPAAIKAAVTSLVYSHTHLVRLRVTQGRKVLADVGGPYILAPVSGTLRLHGRGIAHYVMSVQDDLGYVKLVTRFLGVPIVLRAGAHTIPVEGVFSPAPATIPDRGPVKLRGRAYEAYSFEGTAFPSGPLRISLLIPVPSSLSRLSCAEIRTAELGVVAQRISRRFRLTPASLPVYARLARTLTGGGLVVYRSPHLSSTVPGPPHLPRRGAVKYRGRTYGVSSFSTTTSVGSVRVYLLVAT